MAKRINTTLKETDKFGSGKHGWTDGVSPPTDSTSGEAEFFDQVQEEIAFVVESGGYVIPEAEVLANRNMMLAIMRMMQLTASLSSAKTLAVGYTIHAVVGADTAEDAGLTWKIVGNSATVTTYNAGSDTLLTDTAPGAPTDIRNAHHSAAEGLWVLVSDGGDLWTQTDGFAPPNPIQRTSNTAEDLTRVIFAESIWVAGGANGEIITSPDAVTAWTVRTSNMTGTIDALAHDGSTFLATTQGVGNEAVTSPDGITWTPVTVTGMGTSQIFDVVFSTLRGLWYAIVDGGDSDGIYSSVDAVAWTQLASINGLDSIHIDSNGIMIANNARQMFISDGRQPWTKFVPNFDLSGGISFYKAQAASFTVTGSDFLICPLLF